MGERVMAAYAAHHFDSNGIKGVLQGQSAADVLWPLGVRYAQKYSHKRVGMSAGHPSDRDAVATLAAIVGDTALLVYDGRTIQVPLAEVFDPDTAIAYMANLAAPGVLLRFSTEEEDPVPDLPPTASVLEGPPPAQRLDRLPHAARRLLIAGWSKLRQIQHEWQPGYVAVLSEEGDGFMASFGPAALVEQVIRANVELKVNPPPLSPGVLRVFVATKEGVISLDLPASPGTSRPSGDNGGTP